ncbi:MAG: SusC/RagA family TonB-linked outer membrane protein [Chitinophagales bacterium]
MKRTLFLWLFGLILTAQVYAQNRSLSGTVKDAKGEALIGVNVTGKGTTIGAVTDIDGNYTLELPKDVTTLVFSYTGYTTLEKVITTLKTDVVLVEEPTTIEEVVVTALAVKREARSTSFATQTLKSEDFNKTGRNVFDALQGKTAGVKINSTSGQVGTSNRIVIRGESSITGDNNALFVVDGIPINNESRGDDNFVANYTDFGSRGNDFNPDDIESMTVLAGPAATALYGSRGAGGVIVITTKSGKSKEKDKIRVGINTGVQFDKAYVLLKRQDKYGEGYYPSGIVNGENFSWGPAFDGRPRIWTAPTTLPDGQTAQLIRPYSAVKNQLDNFFDLGITTNTGINFSGNTDKFNYFVSYGNTNNKGIMPGLYYKRNNVSFNGGANITKNFSTSFGLKYSNVNTDQKVSGREFANPYQAAIQTPVNIPFNEIRDINSPFHNLEGFYGSYTPNPYYVLSKLSNISKSHNFLANLEINYKPIDDLTLTARIGDNITITDLELKVPKYTYTTDRYNPDNFGGARSGSDGRYELDKWTTNDLTLDLIGAYKKDLGKKKNFNISLLGGLSYYDKSSAELNSSTVGGLVIADFYDLSNSAEQAFTNQFSSKERLLGVFGNVEFSYKRFIFLNYTARNDWSSTLPQKSNKFFYQSGGLTFVPTELFKTPNKWLNYLKIRANAGTVGKGADPYKIYSVYLSNPVFDDYSQVAYQTKFPWINNVSGYTKGNNIGSPNLKPEITLSWEVGTDIGLFDDRFKVQYTYYEKRSKNQIINVSLPASSGYATQTKNIGAMYNKGHELSVFVTPVRNIRGLTWDLRMTYSKNNNKVTKVADDIKELALGGSTDAGTFAVEGKPLGTWKVFDWAIDSASGKYIVDATGKPTQASVRQYEGSYQPKYMMGWGSTLSFRGLSIDVQFDMKKGGQFYSGTKELGEFNGTTLSTLRNDRLPFIMPNSVVKAANGTYIENTTPLLDPYPFFRDLPSKYMLIDASYIKLREASVSYTIPTKYFKNTPISTITFGIYGRNLKYWLPKENVYADPETNSVGGNTNDQGFEQGATPSSRSYGFNFKIEF